MDNKIVKWLLAALAVLIVVLLALAMTLAAFVVMGRADHAHQPKAAQVASPTETAKTNRLSKATACY